MKAIHPSSSSDSLWGGDSDGPDMYAEPVWQTWRILLPLIAVAGLIALWLATAPLVATVVASSPVRAELSRRIALHQEGGVAREILVRDGTWVRTGRPLVALGNRRAFCLAISDWPMAVGQIGAMSRK